MLDEQTSSASPVEETPSTTADTVDAVGTDTSSEQGVSATSPGAEAGVTDTGSPPVEDAAPKSMFEAVTAALNGSKEAVQQQEAPAADPGSDQTDKPADVQMDDDAKLPFGKHPRFQALIKERNELRGPAEQFGKIEAFMKQSNLTPNEVVEGFQVMALMRNDPDRAVSVLLDYARGIQEARGHILPPDLQTQVQDGRVDEPTARELSRLRAEQRAAQEREAALRQAQQAQQVEAVRTDVASAVQQWEQLVRQKDPDFAAKERMVHDRVRAIVSETGQAPRDRSEALALVERAYADVTSYTRAFRPAQAPVRHVPSAHGSTPPARPNSLRDVVRSALGQ